MNVSYNDNRINGVPHTDSAVIFGRIDDIKAEIAMIQQGRAVDSSRIEDLRKQHADMCWQLRDTEEKLKNQIKETRREIHEQIKEQLDESKSYIAQRLESQSSIIVSLQKTVETIALKDQQEAGAAIYKTWLVEAFKLALTVGGTVLAVVTFIKK